MSRASDGAPPRSVPHSTPLPRSTPPPRSAARSAALRRAGRSGSDPRQGTVRRRHDGTVDLRLVPPALAVWATAALALDAPRGWVAGIVVGCLVTGLILLWRSRAGARPWDRVGDVPPSRPAWRGASVGALLLCVAGSAVSAGLHGADVRRGPVPGLAREYATVTAEVELTGDPWVSRPRVRGDHTTSAAVLARGEVRRVERDDGTVVTTRSPVLVVVDTGVPAPGGGGRAEWLGLLPSTRLRVTGRLAAPTVGGDRVAAMLRVREHPAPIVVGEPSGPQRLAGRLRAGLREATDGLPEDARALLPGLVVGDTSRITPELDEAFEETDLAHTLAVSGSNLTILLALLIGPPGLAQQVERRGLAPRLGLSLRATALFSSALTLGFVVVCRPDPSVLRAAACGAVALLALATGRRRSLMPALATAVLLLVLYDPWLSRSYGFLLSVLATGSLLVLAPGWSEALRRRGVPERLAEGLAAAAAAQAVCGPG